MKASTAGGGLKHCPTKSLTKIWLHLLRCGFVVCLPKVVN